MIRCINDTDGDGDCHLCHRHGGCDQLRPNLIGGHRCHAKETKGDNVLNITDDQTQRLRAIRGQDSQGNPANIVQESSADGPALWFGEAFRALLEADDVARVRDALTHWLETGRLQLAASEEPKPGRLAELEADVQDIKERLASLEYGNNADDD